MFRVILLVGYAFLPSLYRAFEVENHIRSLTGVAWRSFFEALRNDFPIIAAILALLLFSSAFARRKSLSWLCFGFVVLLHIVLIADVVIYKEFAQRLTIADAFKHGGYTLNYLLDLNVRHVVAIAIGAFALIALTAYVWRLASTAGVTARSAIIGTLLLGALSTLAWQTRDTGYVHYRFYQNLEIGRAHV